MGGEAVARSRAHLEAGRITHIVNASAYITPETFRAAENGAAADGGPALTYRSLWLRDCPGEDLLWCVLPDTVGAYSDHRMPRSPHYGISSRSVMMDVADWLADARAEGGCVLVHCAQGVSRSCSLVCLTALM